ncbi:hypothetical protein [Rhizobium sp. K102]|uniref:hypothetical protein n=1 Tax=Rhizobium sp. K102 TaxID=2918527 RepID=UPI001EFB515C|nr:hypothetical protein [Rhizobium sp. K102]ULR47025.1 hypothetical protein MHI61_29800 [Rhizobium sp. K102]
MPDAAKDFPFDVCWGVSRLGLRRRHRGTRRDPDRAPPILSPTMMTPILSYALAAATMGNVEPRRLTPQSVLILRARHADATLLRSLPTG